MVRRATPTAPGLCCFSSPFPFRLPGVRPHKACAAQPHLQLGPPRTRRQTAVSQMQSCAQRCAAAPQRQRTAVGTSQQPSPRQRPQCAVFRCISRMQPRTAAWSGQRAAAAPCLTPACCCCPAAAARWRRRSPSSWSSRPAWPWPTQVSGPPASEPRVTATLHCRHPRHSSATDGPLERSDSLALRFGGPAGRVRVGLDATVVPVDLVVRINNASPPPPGTS